MQNPQTTVRVVSKTLTDRYLRQANEQYFAPRGLRIRLCRTASMRLLLGMDPIETPSKAMETAKAIGRGVESVALHLPVIKNIITRSLPASTAIDERAESDFASRRVATTQGYSLPLDFNVPPPTMPTGASNNDYALGIKLRQWQDARANAKASHARQILAIRNGAHDDTGLVDSFGRDGRLARKALKMAERDIRKGRVPMASRQDRMRVAIEDRNEETAAGGILWLLVLDEEQG